MSAPASIASETPMSQAEIFSLIGANLGRVEEFIRLDAVCSVDAVTEISRHLQLSGGKRLRPTLVLLHDFPEFLCEYHFELCNVVPPSCIQMRNLILSAFPRNMRLPDPFTPNLKVRSPQP